MQLLLIIKCFVYVNIFIIICTFDWFEFEAASILYRFFILMAEL